jgi:predicted alpha/beta-fold hydrolase
LRPFVPVVSNPHLLTIAGNYWPRNLDFERFPTQIRVFDTAPGVRILVHSHEPDQARRGDVVLVHGLEGSSDAGYMQSAAQAVLTAGFAAHRMNLRSCGGTEAWSGDTLYHSGLTSDLRAVLKALRDEGRGPLYVAGYSLGGNVSLKLAGELGREGETLLDGVCAVSTPIDLAACVETLAWRQNLLYARRFLSRLKRRIVVKNQLRPGLFPVERLPEVHSIYDFDDVFTAPSFGFGTAANYYATQSANRFLNDIRVPTLLVQSKDDPLIPFRVFDHPSFRRNPNLRLLATTHGGHLGYLSRRKPRFWLDETIVEWLRNPGNRAPRVFVSLTDR